MSGGLARLRRGLDWRSAQLAEESTSSHPE